MSLTSRRSRTISPTSRRVRSFFHSASTRCAAWRSSSPEIARIAVLPHERTRRRRLGLSVALIWRRSSDEWCIIRSGGHPYFFGSHAMRERGWETPEEHAQTLFDRDLELETLRQGLDAAASGSGGVLAVVGAAGMGKTELLRATRARAAAAGFNVL